MIINICGSSNKVFIVLVRFYLSLNFLDRFSKNTLTLNFVKICPVVADLFQADRCTDGRTDGQK